MKRPRTDAQKAADKARAKSQPRVTLMLIIQPNMRVRKVWRRSDRPAPRIPEIDHPLLVIFDGAR